MTLLLAAELPHPFLLGDLLVTRRGAGPCMELPLPSVGLTDVNKALQRNPDVPDRISFSGLSQKLCQINEYLVVGWSGPVFFARLLIRRLKQEIGNNQIDPRSLQKVLSMNRDLTDNSLGKLDVICLGIHASQPNGYMAWRNCQELRSHFGTTVVGGYGSSMLRDSLNLFGKDTTRFSVSPSSGNEEITRFSTGLFWSGLLEVFERTTGQTLANFFGAGFEIASVINGTVRKADNFNKLFLLIKEAQNRAPGRLKLDLWAPTTLSRLVYDDEGNLIIVRMEGGTLKVLNSGRSGARSRGEGYFFINRLDHPVDVGRVVPGHSWNLNMLAGGKYTMCVAAHVTDRIHNIVVGLVPAEVAAVEVGRINQTWWVDLPINWAMMDEMATQLGL